MSSSHIDWDQFLRSSHGGRFPLEIQQLAVAEAKFSSERQRALSLVADGRAVDSRVLDTVRNDILPKCRDAVNALEQSKSIGALPDTIIDILVQYHVRREQAWLAFERAIQDLDPTQAQHHQRLLENSTQILSQIRQLEARSTEVQNNVSGFQSALGRMTPRTWVVSTLVLANVLIFVAMLFAGSGLFETPGDIALRWGANYGPKTLSGEWWRLVSCMFVHFGLIHVAFNMWVLWQLGQLVERLVGNIGFIILYVTSGIFASIASLAWNPTVVSAGASGAVFGVCGALLGFLALRRDTVPAHVLKPLRTSLIAFVGYNVVFGALIPNIDMAAHLGGLVFGFGCGLLLSQPIRADVAARRWQRNLITVVCAGVVLPLALFMLPDAPPDIDAELQRIIKLEEKALAQFDTLMEQHSRETLDAGEFADAVEKDVLGPYQQAKAIIEPLLELPYRNGDAIRNLLDYITLRTECWQLLITAQRNHDPAKMELFWKKMVEANQAAKETHQK